MLKEIIKLVSIKINLSSKRFISFPHQNQFLKPDSMHTPRTPYNWDEKKLEMTRGTGNHH